MDFRRLKKVWPHVSRPARPAEELSADKVDAGYRLFWMKMAWQWDGVRRAAMAEAVETLTASEDFEKNLFERRFRVDGLDDLAHSGASLLALGEVLAALEAFEEKEAADRDAVDDGADVRGAD